ncbi:hypothetical protein CQW49_22390 (plasmid) [Methylosinus trichosporium OB3b]|uniref:Uncharacterized protein n=1 Tax=Methylosinus trichosporium (strain ATCC 35070 / NCIMB 11131 / UNIQEM 75 / OB3b) TaxID=595536 RepID=A0A2D2D6W3_METT3|nr:DUF6678 family protein [Methylosinus trichosporium]ATQ70738.1 hypothetical protein CQW49_22390 [Methylosinus trichosporium OB3b]
MVIHGREELQRVGRRVQARAHASLMSDTKWRKVLSELNKPEWQLEYCIVKFIDVTEEKLVYFPIGLSPPRPWVDTFGFGPITLRSIEWMLIPRIAKYKRGNPGVPDGEIEQDVEAIMSVIDKLGKYPVQLTDRGLLIMGHVTETHSC